MPASASTTAPRPPTTCTADPAPLPPEAAAWNSRLAVVPADHGPAKVPKMPRAHTIARIRSVVNHSAAKSATAIGPKRSSRYASSRPRPRKPIASPASGSSSALTRRSMSGGVMDSRRSSSAEIAPSERWNSG